MADTGEAKPDSLWRIADHPSGRPVPGFAPTGAIGQSMFRARALRQRLNRIMHGASRIFRFCGNRQGSDCDRRCIRDDSWTRQPGP